MLAVVTLKWMMELPHLVFRYGILERIMQMSVPFFI